MLPHKITISLSTPPQPVYGVITLNKVNYKFSSSKKILVPQAYPGHNKNKYFI